MKIDIPAPDNYLQPVLDEIMVEDNLPEDVIQGVLPDEQAVVPQLEIVDRFLDDQVFAPEFPDGIEIGEGPRRSQRSRAAPKSQQDYVSEQDLDQVVGPSDVGLAPTNTAQ